MSEPEAIIDIVLYCAQLTVREGDKLYEGVETMVAAHIIEWLTYFAFCDDPDNLPRVRRVCGTLSATTSFRTPTSKPMETHETTNA